MVRQRILAVFLLINLIGSHNAPATFAADEDIAYPIRVPYRIIRGVTNIGLGWTEILLRPIGEARTETFMDSLARSSFDTMQRASGGFQDIFMCWVPDMQMEEIYPDWQVWPYLFHWS